MTKNYDSDRHFHSKWRFADDGTERFWLIHDSTTGLLGCLVCREHAQGKASGSNFAKCTAECKKDTIKKHKYTMNQ